MEGTTFYGAVDREAIKHLDLRGKFVTPALTDGHAHLALIARAAEETNVGTARTPDELIALLPQRDYIVAYGLRFHVDHALLERAFPGVPVVVRRVDEHCGVFTKATGFQGWLYEADFDKAMRTVPRPKLDLRKAALSLRAQGIAHVHDMAVLEEELPMYEGLPIKVTPYLYAPDEDTYLAWCRNQPKHGIKLFLDGALGSRGARLLQPYHDDPHTHGLRYMAHPERIVEAAAKAGIPVAMHAIGDAAVREALDLIERYRPPSPRIEHAQVVHPDDVPRFNGVFTGVQFQHHHDDAAFTEQRLGPRQAHTWKALKDAGAILVGGSDAPIASATPVLQPGRGITPLEALAAYTVNADKAAGTHTPGITVWNNDPLSAAAPSVAWVWP